jgi:hypothetical protein
MNFIKQLQVTERDRLLTGQLFFRHTGPAMEMDMSKREVYGVVGVVALPVGHLIKSEHQYTITGFESLETSGLLLAGVDMLRSIDLAKRAKGNNMGDLLMKPIWRI